MAKPKTAPKTAQKKITKSQLSGAQDAAREGRIADARPTLEAAAEQGSASAAYSLAEIAALQGDWDGVLARLAQFMPNEKQIYAGNVKRDVAGLLWRAAEETGRWPEAAKLLAGMKENAVGGLFYKSLKRLLTAKGKGAAPKLVHVMGTAKDYAEHVAKAKAEKDAFGVVMNAKEHASFDADVVAHFAAAEDELTQFDYVLDCIPAFVRQKKVAAGWAAFTRKLSDWMNVEDCQIAPIVVLWDPAMRPMMTPPRCAALLSRKLG